ncbi:MAG: Coenzyme F420 hydrogenase/dehydrogenase, beta subunit C-terminal domain [Methanosarcinales archaeon]|nr:Coenzyme F420 hydrogenase/dehydrogenase, beta subunit C-terminal domain [Methanosarcinales archaeon]
MTDEEYKWFLRNEVVDAGLCTFCGACAAVCPNDRIEFKADGPALKEECPRNGQGACKDVCQRVVTFASKISPNIFGFKAKPPSLLGQYETIVAARAADPTIRDAGQDGGAVTALLTYCMNEGLIDGVIATGDIGKPSSCVVRSEEELLKTAGSKYSSVPVLSAIKDAGDITNAAVVGLPCQVNGIRKTQFFPGLTAHGYEVGENGEKIKIPNIAYVIGLFCTENFNYEKLADFMEERGLDISNIRKATIHLDELVVMTDSGSYEFDLNDLWNAGCVLDGCVICRDAVSKLADISAGYMGSGKGWTTLMGRTAKGIELIKAAEEAGYIETKPEVDLHRIEEFAGLKMQRFNWELKRRLDEGKNVKFYWASDYPGVMGETKGTFFVKIKTNSGLIGADQLAKAAELANKYGDRTFEITTRQSVEIQGVPGTNVDKLMSEIYASGLATIGMGYVSSCVGMDYCTEGLVETKKLSGELTMAFAQKLTPHKMKIGIAGCGNDCVRAKRHDIGLIGQVHPEIDTEKCNGCGRCAELCRVDAISIVYGNAVIDKDKCISCGWCIRGCPNEAAIEKERGYTMWIGANDARRPSDGILLKSFCTTEEIPELIDAVAGTFVKYRTKPGRERLGNVIANVGEGMFLKEVLDQM